MFAFVCLLFILCSKSIGKKSARAVRGTARPPSPFLWGSNLEQIYQIAAHSVLCLFYILA